MKTLLENHDLILMEAAIVERLRRAGRVALHPNIVHAGLIYDDQGKKSSKPSIKVTFQLRFKQTFLYS